MPKSNHATDQPFLPRYEVTGLVGEGAAALVYRVTDQHSGAVRAIKALRPETNADESVVKRFEDEFRILRGLHHPSLPDVHDYGFTEDGIRYIVMDLVDGQRLDDYFAANPGNLWLLLYELCEVLTFIHDRNLLHLDLKPANILVKRTSAYGDEKPMVVLMDFGLSYRRETGEAVNLVGTPEYMAPEIIKGDDRITRAADYYSLGISLYELLTGQTPFRGKINEVFAGHLRDEVRFREEKTEYAELYPHVLGLVGKEINPRLESFEEFRRAVIGRLGGGVDELERAYGLSIIQSIGMIGKEEVWAELTKWLDQMDAFEAVHNKISTISVSETKTQSSEDYFRSDTSPNDSISQGLAQQLLSEVPETTSIDTQPTLDPPARVIILSGPSGSGKAYIVDQLIENCHIRGRTTWEIGSDDSNANLGNSPLIDTTTEHSEVKSGKAHIDPASVLLDRYSLGWNRLAEAGRAECTVFFLHNYENLAEDQKGFLDYVSKRIVISQSDDDTPNIFLVICGNEPQLKKMIDKQFNHKLVNVSLTIPPLYTTDLENLSDRFHINAVTDDDKRTLNESLIRFANTTETLFSFLEYVSLKGHLSFKMIGWQFKQPSIVGLGTAQDPLVGYYKDLIHDWTPQTRDVLEWVCCHDGPVSLETISGLSGIGTSFLTPILENIDSYHLVEYTSFESIPSVTIAGKRLQDALYSIIPDERRDRIHKTYANHYDILFQTAYPSDINKVFKYGKQVIHHFTNIGDNRRVLLVQVRLTRLLKAQRRYLELRSICDNALSFLDNGTVYTHFTNKSHVHRYFLKNTVAASWFLSDYSSIRNRVERYYLRRLKKIPLGVVIQYCLALLADGHNDKALELTIVIEKRSPDINSEAHVTALLMRANVLIQITKFNEATKVLYHVKKRMHLLGDYGRCRVYTCFILLADRLNDVSMLNQYGPLLEELSVRNKYYHELLMTNTMSFYQYFNQSRLDKAKALTRKAIPIALKHKLYRRLVECYFRASAVYYESGSYDRSIRYVQKALAIAKRIGLVDIVSELETRLAMNYKNAGLYGNSLLHVTRALNGWNEKWNANVGVTIVLFAFEAHLNINSRYVDRYRKRATNYIVKYPEVQRYGYYSYLIGLDYLKKGLLTQSRSAFRKSRMIELKDGSIDDAVRSGIKEAFVLLEQSNFTGANQLIEWLNEMRKDIESPNIQAEYSALQLARSYLAREKKSVLAIHINKCEKSYGAATEVPVLLTIDKILFRAKARIGDIAGAKIVFKKHLDRLKYIVGNMPDRNHATRFLNDRDGRLIFKESKILLK